MELLNQNANAAKTVDVVIEPVNQATASRSIILQQANSTSEIDLRQSSSNSSVNNNIQLK